VHRRQQLHDRQFTSSARRKVEEFLIGFDKTEGQMKNYIICVNIIIEENKRKLNNVFVRPFSPLTLLFLFNLTHLQTNP